MHRAIPAFERVDIGYASRPEWMTGEPVKGFLDEKRVWRCDASGAEIEQPNYIRRYHEAVHDSEVDCRTGRASLDLEHLPDGGALLKLQSVSMGRLGSVALNPAEVEALADWINKVVEANKQ